MSLVLFLLTSLLIQVSAAAMFGDPWLHARFSRHLASTEEPRRSDRGSPRINVAGLRWLLNACNLLLKSGSHELITRIKVRLSSNRYFL